MTAVTPPGAAHRGWTRWGVLVTGILAISTGSVLVRLAPAPALAIGAWRLLLATLLLTPCALPAGRREWARLDARDWRNLSLAGVALAIHFATWITSLGMTSVASSVILVSTNPIWVGLATHFWLGERAGSRTVWAIVLAMVGTVVISFGDIELSQRALLGDGLALVGAIAGSAYLLLGRSVRRKLSTVAYVWPCYGLCGLLLLAMAIIAGQPLGGYPLATYGLLALLAIGPQILGHSSFNWALGYFTPVFVTLALLCEPIGATLLAWLMLGESPQPTAVLGGVLIIVGVYVASTREAPTPASHLEGTP